MEEARFEFDVQTRVRDNEEKQRLLKDRLLLIGKSLVENKEQTAQILTELKRTTFLLTQEVQRMKEVLNNCMQQLNSTSRKEELAILQRQFDLFRNHGN